jgi:hypothetical protein
MQIKWILLSLLYYMNPNGMVYDGLHSVQTVDSYWAANCVRSVPGDSFPNIEVSTHLL